MAFTPEVQTPFGQSFGTLTPHKVAKISQSVALADFTDVDATGYVDLTAQLPAGAIPLGYRLVFTARGICQIQGGDYL